MLGCDGAGDPTPVVITELGPEIRMNQFQAKGTHNSYHLAPDPLTAPESCDNLLLEP